MKNLYSAFICFCCMLSFGLRAQQITTVSPDTVVQGQSLTVSISGQNTSFQQGSSTSWLTRSIDAIVPAINSVQSPTLINSIYQIPSNASVGFWDVHVIDGQAGELIKLDGVYIDQFVGLDARGPGIRESIALSPNPMQDRFVLDYQLPSVAQVHVRILDMKGQLIADLLNDVQDSGPQRLELSVSEVELPAGVFLVVLQVDDMAFAIKATAIK